MARFLPLDARGHGAFQIVATLGPASFERARELADAGATSLRLNASHLEADALVAAVDRIRVSLPGAPIVVDLQGAKMRLGVFAPRTVAAGERLRVSCVAETGALPLPHRELFAAVRAGEILSCDDDRLRLRVVSVDPAGELEAVALGPGVLQPRKGVNRAEHPVELEDLAAHDLACLAALRDREGLAFAISFVRDGRELEWLRRRVAEGVVIAKLERAEALASLPAHDASADALWLCRGDLGAQLGPVALARAVAALDPRSLARPTLMAGQVLEHLTAHAEPTRSEVCHLFDLCARGYAGIVLSDETAIGRDPVAAVRTAAALCEGMVAGRLV
jgi:pyruvate kinase